MNILSKHLQRVLGVYDQNISGPTVICTCGIHGNEPSGVIAFEQVLNKLNELHPPMRGKLIGLAGNITALSEGARFIDLDLNRIWTNNYLKKLPAKSKQQTVEELELKYLSSKINQVFSESTGPIYFIDLHTTSSESQPFLSINDTLRNRHFAMGFPLPIILGMEEYLEGTILNYINELGYIAMGVEAGQHDDPSSVKNHEAAIWLSLFNAGCIDPSGIANNNKYYEILAKSTMNERKVFEVVYRQGIEPEELFYMSPGYINFQRIHKNETLAVLNQNAIKAKESGRVFMPLYQELGNDGFFIIRRIRPFWLKISEYLRKLRLEKSLHYLPGISRHKSMDHVLIIDLRIARWYVIEFFHLMGFRRKKKDGKKLILIKRKHDIKGPESVKLIA